MRASRDSISANRVSFIATAGAFLWLLGMAHSWGAETVAPVMKCDDFPAIIANKDPSATCYDKSPNVTPTSEDYPKENPHPVIHYLLSGRLEADMHFDVVMAWVATNPTDCEYYTSRRYGASAAYRVEEVLAPRRTGNRYEVEVVLDEKLPGRCMWKPWRLYFRGGNTFTSEGIEWAGQEADEEGFNVESASRDLKCEHVPNAGLAENNSYVCLSQVEPIIRSAKPGSGQINFDPPPASP